jgi:uncharacterized membrane protein
MKSAIDALFCHEAGVGPMIRLQCEHCGKSLTVQRSRAGALGTRPHCKEQFHVPGNSPPPARDDQSAEATLSFSRPGLLKALVWLLSLQLLAFIVMVGSVIGCVVIVLKEPLSFQMILGVVFVALVGVVGFCFFVLTLSGWRLFFFSTISSSSHYLVMSDRLVRYSRAGKVVEKIPFANITDVRLLTRRNVADPEVTGKVLGIDLKNLDDRETIRDRQFCLWSQKNHQHDLILIEEFFRRSPQDRLSDY